MRTLLTLVVFCALVPCLQTLARPQATAGADVEATLAKLGIKLPTPAKPMANYVLAVRSNNLVFLSGAGPRREDGTYVTGKVGQNLTLDEGNAAARLTALTQLAALKAELGSLNRVKRIVKVLGMVNADPAFADHPKVINGFSDLMVQVFGERGKHARSAIGVASLPMNIAVEIEMAVEVEP